MASIRERNVGEIPMAAPVGGTVAGVFRQIEGIFGYFEETKAAGELVLFRTQGHNYLPAETSAAWAFGEPLYWDPVAANVTKVQTGALLRIGKAAAVKAETTAFGWVEWNGVSAFDTSAETGGIQGVTAGTGLSGGGTSGSVTVGLSEASQASLALADSALQPGASLTDGTLPVANADGELVDSALTNTAATTLTDGSDATALHVHTDMVGDSGAGGVAGFVPAPAAGDAAAGKYLDADGTWTVPPSDPMFEDRMRRSTSTNQTATTATPLQITFETEEVTGDVTYQTGDFTVPEDGVYAVTASLTFATSAGGTERLTHIYVDGESFEDGYAGPDGSNPVTASASVVVYLPAYTAIAVYGEQDSGGDLDVTAGRIAIQRVQ